MKTQLLYIFISTGCFSWVLWEADAKMELRNAKHLLEITPAKDKRQAIGLERKDSARSAYLMGSQSIWWGAREQRLVIGRVLHWKDWHAPVSLPCLIIGWGSPEKKEVATQKLRQTPHVLTACGLTMLVGEHQGLS